MTGVFPGYEQIEFTVDTETWFETLNSHWVLRPDTYCRLPKIEGPRPPHWSPALADGVWLGYQRVWLVQNPLTAVGILRILPDDRPETFYGVHTSDLVSIPTQMNLPTSSAQPTGLEGKRPTPGP